MIFTSMTIGEQVEPELMNIKGKTKKEVIDLLSRSFGYVNLAAKNITGEQSAETRPWGNPIEQELQRTNKEFFIYFGNMQHIPEELRPLT